MGVFNSDAEENSFIRNLHLLSFSKEVADTLNLICGMCEKPFLHKKAFHDIETNFLYHEDVVKIIPKILDRTGVINVGGKTSHSAIMARSLKIPAVVGTKSITELVHNNDVVILDGIKGEVILHPTEEEIKQLQRYA